MMGGLTVSIYGREAPGLPDIGGLYRELVLRYAGTTHSLPVGMDGVNATKFIRDGDTVAAMTFSANPGIRFYGPSDGRIKDACERVLGPHSYRVSDVDLDTPKEGILCTIVPTRSVGILRKAKELGL